MNTSTTGPSHGTVESLNHRPDIDGLRALAIIPVCMFHADVSGFSGGFAGVDVFFVISGYLMASLIGRDLSRGKFSYIAFYQRRVRRIFPALFVVLLFCSILSVILLPPSGFYEFGRTLLATVLFSSNILFSLNSLNYFDAPTNLNLLLHTWSLAIEGQFYILFPIFLTLVWKSSKRMQIILTGLAIALSFAAGVWGSVNAPTASFYLLPSRAWELLLGAMLVLCQNDQPKKCQSLLCLWIREIGVIFGLFFILWSVVSFDVDTAMPGFPALAPCAGALLLLHFNRGGGTFAGRLLLLSPLLLIGKVSYSLYLWHWPLITLLDRYLFPEQLGVAQKLMIVAAALALSIVTWRYVEQPFRSPRSTLRPRALTSSLLVSFVPFILIGVAAQASDGWSGRFPRLASIALHPQILREEAHAKQMGYNSNNCFVSVASDWGREKCYLNKHSIENALLWGDSFAHSYAYGFFSKAELPVNMLEYTSPQCPPILNYRAASRPQCTSFNAVIPSIIRDYGITTIVLAANWDSYLKRRKIKVEDIARTVGFLQDMGVRVVVVGQSPIFGFNYPDEYVFNKYGPDRGDDAFYGKSYLNPEINQIIADTARADAFFDPTRTLCIEQNCVIKESGKYIFRDYGHYTNYGSELMVAALLRDIEFRAGISERYQENP